MSPTSCRCSTPRRVLGSPFSARRAPRSALSDQRLGACPPPAGAGRGWGAPAAASPPVGSPPQYSPALRWVTTGFGMGPGGASTLSATGAPHPPTAVGTSRSRGVARDRASLLCPHAPSPDGRTSLLRHHPGNGNRRRNGDSPLPPPARSPARPARFAHATPPHPPTRNLTRAAPGRITLRARRPPAPRWGAAPSPWRGPPRGPPRSAAPETMPDTHLLRGIRPRPLGRLGSSRLPAVHLPPINPVICRGSYLLTQWGCWSWGGIPA